MTSSTPTTPPLRRATDRALPRPPGVPFLFPPAPLDAALVAMCANFGAIERERRRVIALLSAEPANSAALRTTLGRLTADRHGLVHNIITARARTLDGIKKKAAVMRLLVAEFCMLTIGSTCILQGVR